MAWRYLFASKSTNAINTITMIAGFGVAIGAAALILLLSVFNGFEQIFLGMYDNLNPDVHVSATKGKTFELGDATYRGLLQLEGVGEVSQTLEETAVFRYAGRPSFGRIKGVDAAYSLINGIDSLVSEGQYELDTPDREGFGAVVGNQLALSLGIDPLNELEPLTVFMTRPRARGEAASSALTGRSGMVHRDYQPTGVIRSTEAFGTQAVLIPLAEARKLLTMSDSTVSALEIGLAYGADTEATIARIGALMGEGFTVLNREQQQGSLLKIMQIEKWVGFALFCLMMVIISFNLVGALWMIVLEKQRDISVLRSLGMTAASVRGVFLRVGVVLCGVGVGVGFLIATVAGLLQQQYRLFRVAGPLSEPYPMQLRLLDYPVVALVVIGIGLLASLLPAQYAGRIEPVITEE